MSPCRLHCMNPVILLAAISAGSTVSAWLESGGRGFTQFSRNGLDQFDQMFILQAGPWTEHMLTARPYEECCSTEDKKLFDEVVTSFAGDRHVLAKRVAGYTQSFVAENTNRIREVAGLLLRRGTESHRDPNTRCSFGDPNPALVALVHRACRCDGDGNALGRAAAAGNGRRPHHEPN